MTIPRDPSPAAAPSDVMLQIVPEPTDDERDALVAALAILIADPVAAVTAIQARPSPSRWALAGRDAAFEARRVRRGWRSLL